MKTRGIIFSGPMVRAILHGKKRQTRRVHDGASACPYGVAGDRLWVRETFAPVDLGAGRVAVAYRASCAGDMFTYPGPDGATVQKHVARWKSPLFLPRARSRLELEVTASRLERLQDISESDAVLEGCSGKSGHARAEYREVWEALNAKRHPWAANPWVWVVEFVGTGQPAALESF